MGEGNVSDPVSAQIFATADDEDARLLRELSRQFDRMARLRHVEQGFRNALALVPLTLSTQDRALRYTWVHDQYGDLLPAWAEGLNAAAVMPAEVAAPLDALKRQILATGESRRTSFTIDSRLSGQPTHREWTGAPLFDDDGAVVGLTSATLDVTESHRMMVELQAACQQAERVAENKNAYIAAASHDLRQPLQAARLFLEVLSAKAAATGNPEMQAITAKVDCALAAAESQLSGLIDIARLDRHGVTAHADPLDLGDTLRGLEQELRPLVEAKGLSLRVVAPPRLVRSDGVLLARILRNLMHNAVRYTPTGRILVGCRRTAAGTRVEVWDTGIGIAPEHIAPIFQDYYRVDGADGGGTGLGLATVARIARLLGHTIGVRSWPGQGSVFSVSLPAA